jgi:hypothetical protein
MPKPKSSFRMPNQRQTGFDHADVEPVTAKNDKYNYQLKLDSQSQRFLMPIFNYCECKCSDIIWNIQKFLFVCILK